MRQVTRRGTAAALFGCSHPGPAVAMTVVLTTSAALSGRSLPQCALVAGTMASGQLTVGWINDVVDLDRDRAAGRQDKPLVTGRIDTATVVRATVVATAAVLPLSLANGTTSGLAHLGAVGSAWVYDLWLKRTVLSWTPYAVSFGLLPSFLSYGGFGLGPHGAPPPVSMTVSAALLGVGIHVLNVLPDLDEDELNEVRHLPLLVERSVGTRPLAAGALSLCLVAGAGVVRAALRSRSTGAVRLQRVRG